MNFMEKNRATKRKIKTNNKCFQKKMKKDE